MMVVSDFSRDDQRSERPATLMAHENDSRTPDQRANGGSRPRPPNHGAKR
jgi:hypothetical protein